MKHVSAMRPFGVILLLVTAVLGQNSSVVSIPYELTYKLPPGFSNNLEYTFENGTTTSNSTVNDLLQRASQSAFVSYDPEFDEIVGPDPQLELIDTRLDSVYAYESGVWIPDTNQVWFTSASATVAAGSPAFASVLYLDNNTVTPLITDPPIINPNGAYYYNGTVTFASYRTNGSYQGGIISVDPQTLKATTLLNSYFGLNFGGPDDPVWVRCGGKDYLFFDDLNFPPYATEYTDLRPSPLPRGVWRFDPTTEVLSYVISRTDVPLPNGLRVSPDQKTLYVTDNGGLYPDGGDDRLHATTATPAIYAYSILPNDEPSLDCIPTNRRVFGLVRDGIGDGLHVDDAGRVWTGESSGITVRRADGKVLGSFNSQAYLVNQTTEATPLANFALAGDTLVVLAVDRLYRVKLAQKVVGNNPAIIN